MKGEFPFTMGEDGIIVFALGAMRLTQRSSNIRISSGVKDLDEMCGGGLFSGFNNSGNWRDWYR